MSVEIRKYEVPARAGEATTIVCDLCGAKSPEDTNEWPVPGGDPCEHDEIEIKTVRIYRAYGDLAGKGVRYDCCRACFKDKVEPALQALGLKPRAIDW